MQLEDSSDDPNMTTFAKFVSNCRLRADYEAKARLRQGKAKDEPVIVPHPGLLALTEDQR
jgi:hypothetical protein